MTFVLQSAQGRCLSTHDGDPLASSSADGDGTLAPKIATTHPRTTPADRGLTLGTGDGNASILFSLPEQ
jgi:hypothetical protein